MSTIAPPGKHKIRDAEAMRLLNPLPAPSPRATVTIAIALAMLIWGMMGTDARPAALIEGVPSFLDFLSRVLPVEYELQPGTERSINLSSFEIGEPLIVEGALANDLRAPRAKAATPEELANIGDEQQTQTLYKDNRNFLFYERPPDIAVEEIVYLLQKGQRIFIDERTQDTYVLNADEIFQNGYAIPEGKQLVSRRYLINNGEILLGWPTIIGAIVETLQMALIGTLGAIILSMPFGLLAARNISPRPIIYQLTRLALNFNRAVPEIVWAIVIVGAVGLGPFAGVMALTIGSVGSMGKMYAESIEAIDPQQVAAARATGSSPLQVFSFAVMPQAFPLIASYALLVFESNIRAATILGIVGAGGVGFVLQKYAQLFMFSRLVGAILVIGIVATLIDRLSDRIRKAII